MTFPGIPTVANGRIIVGTTTSTSGSRTFPADCLTNITKNAGDLLVAIVIAYQSSGAANAVWSSWSGGFTEFLDSATSTTMAIGGAYKWSDGTETGTITVTEAATVTGHAVYILMSIPGAHASTPPAWGGRTSGTSAAADPTSVNPTAWDVEDTLWIAVAGCGETSTTGSFTGVTVEPTNYGDFVGTGISGDVVGGTDGAVAFRQLAAAAEDAGPFTVDVSNARNAALLIAIRPAAGGTVFNRGPVDSAGMAETFARVASQERSRVDPSGLASPMAQALSASRSQADGAGIADASAYLKILDKSATDPAGLADASSRVVTLARSSIDSAGLLDSVARAVAAARSQTDVAGLASDLLRVMAFARSPQETSGLDDTFAFEGPGGGGAEWVVTARHSAAPHTGDLATRTTDSQTPTASSLLVVASGAENNSHTSTRSVSVSGGGLTYDEIPPGAAGQVSADYPWDGSSVYSVALALHAAAVGSSPSAFAVTVDHWATTNTGYYGVVCADVTGHDPSDPVIQGKVNGASVSSGVNHAGTVTFDDPLTVGSMVLASFTAGADSGGGFATPTLGGRAMAPLHNQNGAYCQTGLWYLEIDGTETNRAITCSDVGNTVGNWAGNAVELRAAPGGGGTTHERSPVDPAGLAESVARVAGLARSHADPLGPTETLTRASASARSHVDAAGLADALAFIKVISGEFADTSGLTDQILRTLASSRSLVDPGGLADSLTRVAAYTRTLGDSAAPTDAVEFVISQARVIGDSAGLADVIARNLFASVLKTDSAGVADAMQRLASAFRTAADSAGLEDAVAYDQSGQLNRTISDSGGLDDVVAQAASMARSQTDSSGLDDTFGHQVISLLTRAIANGVGLGDVFARTLAASRTRLDAVGLGSAIARVSAVARSAADTTGLTDLLARAGTSTRSAVNATGLGDVIQAAIQQVVARSVSDSAGLDDVATRTAAYSKMISNPAGLADAAARGQTILRAAAESTQTTDALGRVAFLARQAFDNAGLLDLLVYSTKLPGAKNPVVADLGVLVDGTFFTTNVAGYADLVTGSATATLGPGNSTSETT